MIKVKDLYKTYDKLQVLKGININVEKGDIYGFLGRNGAGKSTTLNIITGLLKSNSGSIFVDSTEIKNNSYLQLKSVGYLTEDPQFYDYMTAVEYLNFLGNINGFSKKEKNIACDKMMDFVNLKNAKERRIKTYSRGMKQRMGLASILYTNPSLLILDEPSSALDPQGRKKILDIIKILKDSGKTIFFSTHILDDVDRICNKVGIIENGVMKVESDIKSLRKNYLQPIIDIEVKTVNRNIISKINSLQMVNQIKLSENKIEVYLNNFSENKYLLFKELSKLDILVSSYTKRESTLEDIFLRMVNS